MTPSAGQGKTKRRAPKATEAAPADRAQERRRRRRYPVVRRSRWSRRRKLTVLLGIVALLGGIAWIEARTSFLQSWYLSSIAERVRFHVEPGPSPTTVVAGRGPIDLRWGYTGIPDFLTRVQEEGFRIEAQARTSPTMRELVARGLFPIYDEKLQGGLTVYDRSGDVLFHQADPVQVYTEFDAIPALVWRTLLFVESRELLDPRFPRRNPAVEWDRLARAVGEAALDAAGFERNVPGGSTLATQIEKFRHSPEGRTGSATEKGRQILTASVRAYLGGPETLEAQRRIVRDYINTVPFAAQRGHGEVNGLADGLSVWFGTDFETANRLLTAREGALEEGERAQRARIYRQVLGLVLAVRRPSYYLAGAQGRTDLEALIGAHIPLLAGQGVISPDLAVRAAAARLRFLDRAPEPPPPPFTVLKASTSVRTGLRSLLGVSSLYDLDRLDLQVQSSFDLRLQAAAERVLAQLHDPAFVRAQGLDAPRLLGTADPTRVFYTFTLNERSTDGDRVRVRTDNWNGPLDLNTSSRLELGSTAKLRTLVTYLEIVEQLHGRYGGAEPDSLALLVSGAADPLSRWAVGWLGAHPDAALPAMLDAALDRTYSANPAERFRTGFGVQTFANFDGAFNGRVLTVREGFRNSVNLVSIRTLRDIIEYYVQTETGEGARALTDPDSPERFEYLQRFADEEGSTFIRDFYRAYDGARGSELLVAFLRNHPLPPRRLAYGLRAVAADAPPEVLSGLLQSETPDEVLGQGQIASLLESASEVDSLSLMDQGFLASIHPLELFVVRYLLATPQASLSDVLDASVEERQEVYAWLFRTRRPGVQEQRVRAVLELEAYGHLLESWRRVGYPFANLVPSLGTAIGSSGDRPAALTELAGIILGGGVRYPVRRIERLTFARRTPYEAVLRREGDTGERVLSSEVAAALRAVMVDVVENGTAVRARGAFTTDGGLPLQLGGKTGTGDNRYRVFGPNGQLLSERVTNRTATFVFFAGERYYGSIVAYVPGAEAENYRFTSALPSQILRLIGQEMGALP
ncbi:MAG: transglycosylase domain-containing protein [Gemmatimonadota bacterium]